MRPAERGIDRGINSGGLPLSAWIDRGTRIAGALNTPAAASTVG
jgi:hypothetical protein